MGIFIHILTNNIVPIFMLIGIGVLLGWKFRLDVGTLSKLNFYAVMPIYAFVTIYTNDLSATMGKTLLYSLFFLIFGYVSATIAALTFRLTDKKKNILINSSILYNTGNIGIPLMTLIFTGTPYLQQALVIQITLVLVQSILSNTIALFNAGRGEMHWKESILSVFRMPAIYAIVIASVLKQFDYDLSQSFVWPAFDYIKQAMIGLALITLGAQLSNTKIAVGEPDVIISVILRLIIGPLGTLLILRLMGIDGILGRVLFIASAAPTAVLSALVAIECNAEPAFAAKAVMFSTIFCSITLVFVVYFSGILFPL